MMSFGWNNWYVQDALVAVLLIGLARVVWILRREPYWRAAARELARRKMALVSMGIIGVYALIAVLDSVGWHPALRDPAGAPMRGADGRVVRDPKGLSALDWIATPLRERREKTYSAPFARVQFTPEFVPDAEGNIRQVYPKLNHPGAHPLGTDKVGEDVLYQALKGVRTGVILGLVTTLMVIPFAIFFGVVAGYFGGVTDDLIQYLYTVLASIPSILLIAAFIMIFGRGLPQLVLIMGITSWTGLCRVLRGETLKLREMEYVQSAESLGQSPVRIIRRHIVPNLMHLVVITLVLGFSGRVLSEAALTYVGVGVGADTYSWGRMINDARMELARDPVVWWKLAAAFVAMFGIVLPANVFGDAIRDALDPRLRTR